MITSCFKLVSLAMLLLAQRDTPVRKN